MSWATGTGLFSEVIVSLVKNVPEDETRAEIYKDLIGAFTDYDWDAQDECLGEDNVYDEVYKDLYGDLLDEDE